jgi:hypothetical protein
MAHPSRRIRRSCPAYNPVQREASWERKGGKASLKEGYSHGRLGELTKGATGPDATRKVLFVCTANISRSPIAEAIFNALVSDWDMPHKAQSAGTVAAGRRDHGPLRRLPHRLGNGQPEAFLQGVLRHDGRAALQGVYYERVLLGRAHGELEDGDVALELGG